MIKQAILTHLLSQWKSFCVCFSHSSILFSSFLVLLLLLQVASTNSQNIENLNVCQIKDRHSKRPDGPCLKVLRELTAVFARSLCIIFEKSWKLGDASLSWLEKSKCYTHLQKRPKGQSRELQTSQSHFDPWENLEVSPLGRYFWAYIREWRWWGTVSMDLPMVTRYWPTWLSSVIK